MRNLTMMITTTLLPLLLFLSPQQHVQALSAATNNPGVMLRPSTTPDESNFDSTTVAYPVILPPTPHNPKWQCYYYGRGDSWKSNDDSKSVNAFLPTGWIGRAESKDGLSGWVKEPGVEEGGSLLAPTGEADDWDGAHIGVGDVVLREDLMNGDDKDILDMIYFGGSGRVLEMIPGGPAVAGLDMQIGRARSTDGGLTWHRLGQCLERDTATEGLFCAFPQVTIVNQNLWRLIYHSFNGKIWTAYSAVSRNQGETWERQGILLEKGDDGAWDDLGVGCRSMIRIPPAKGSDSDKEEYLMIYEGVASADSIHRLGVAYGTANEDGKLVFTKDVAAGALLAAGEAPLWLSDAGVGFAKGNIGTPYLVRDPKGGVALRLYFVCIHQKSFEIGCVVSPTGDPTKWELPSVASVLAEEQ